MRVRYRHDGMFAFMPWHVEAQHPDCPDDSPWAVVKDDDGEVEGCHETEDDANAQVAALYASEEESSSEGEALTADDPVLQAVYSAFGGDGGTSTFSGVSTSGNTAGQVRLTRLDNQGNPTTFSQTFQMEVVAPPVNAEQEREREFDPIRFSKGLWRGVLAVEGVETGDSPRREFAEGSMTWREPPLSIYWQKVTAEGHDNAFIVANAVELWRDPAIPVGDGRTAPGIRAWGRFNLESDEAREVHGMIGRQFLRGVSVTIDETQESDIEYIWPEPPEVEGDDEPSDEDIMAMMFAMPEKVIFHRARIMDACLTGQPALPEASVELVPDDQEIELTGERPDAVIVAGAFPVRPPTAWFQDPKLDGPTPATFLDSGRVYGHLATWGTCHLSFAPRMCVTPPHAGDYSAFRHGVIVTDEGDQVAVGQVTMGTVHAPAQLGLVPAVQHYEHTGWAVADVAIGEDRFGIWMAGALRPNVTEVQLRALRASGWSGDWRKDKRGKWFVAGALVVNVQGFPIPRTRAYAHDGEQVSLVASGVLLKKPSNVIPISVAETLARSIGRDYVSRREAMRRQVHPSIPKEH